MLQRRAFYYSYFPLRGLFLPSGTLKWISNHVMVCKWEFRFLDLLMAIFLDFLERFTIYSLLILKESVGQAKWQRNLGFGTYFLFIITYWLKLRFFENLANQCFNFLKLLKNQLVFKFLKYWIREFCDLKLLFIIVIYIWIMWLLINNYCYIKFNFPLKICHCFIWRVVNKTYIRIYVLR